MQKYLLIGCLVLFAPLARSQERIPAVVDRTPLPYEYEIKPDSPELSKFNPAKAPLPGSLVIEKGDRLAILGDSITEQRMYSRIIETYLTVCYPDLDVHTRQFGWSGEKADGLLARMDNDVLRFEPTLATICYGMNDARYRPLDWTNARRFRDQITQILQILKSRDCKVVLGTPGCTGKIAHWVASGSGTLDEHNLALCTFRDLCIEIAATQSVRLADVFWPMYVARVVTSQKYDSEQTPYHVAGSDGVHPDWAGHVIMAYAFLRTMGIDGDLGTITLDAGGEAPEASGGHTIKKSSANSVTLTSTRYPFCATGPIDRDDSVRSGTTLVPFHQELNRLTLRVIGLGTGSAEISWGDQKATFSAEKLAEGILLAQEFPTNPFSEAFEKVDAAVLEKQTYERDQIKKVFHGQEGKQDMQAAVQRTEAERASLVEAIQKAFVPVEHTISFRKLD